MTNYTVSLCCDTFQSLCITSMKLKTQSNREFCETTSPGNWLSPDLRPPGQAGWSTRNKQQLRKICGNSSQKIIVGLKVCVFREPVNLLKTSSCQIISSLQAYLFPSYCSNQPASESNEILAIARGSFCPQKKFYTVHHHSIPTKTSMIYSIVS